MGEPSPQSLAGQSFSLSSVNDADVEGTDYTLSFEGETLHAKFCNNMNGGYFGEGTTLQAPLLTATLMYCAEPAYLMEYEGLFAKNIAGGVSWSLVGDTLTLTGADATFVYTKITE